jgi:hypothetical protein
MPIILINGKKRSGKDYFAELLKEEIEKHDETVEIIAFADSIKNILCISLGVDLDTFNDYKNDREPIIIKGKEYNDVRLFIQKFGTEAMQNALGKTVWVDVFLKQVELSYAPYIIVPDFRFKHEYIKDAHTIKVVNNYIKSKDTHASETELDDFEFQHIIDNTGHPDLKPLVKEYVKKLGF